MSRGQAFTRLSAHGPPGTSGVVGEAGAGDEEGGPWWWQAGGKRRRPKWLRGNFSF